LTDEYLAPTSTGSPKGDSELETIKNLRSAWQKGDEWATTTPSYSIQRSMGFYTRNLERVVLDVKAISIILSEQRILAHIIESTYGARIKRWELALRAKS
jgi:hypothetical protein